MHSRLIAALTLITLSATAGAQTDPVRWRGTVAPGRAVEIVGVLGGVTAVPSTGREVVVEARQSARDPEDSVTFAVTEHAGGVTICAMYPIRGSRPRAADTDAERHGQVPDDREGGPGACEHGESGHVNLRRNRTRVEWTVHVPAGVAFVARTVQGDVQAEGLTGDVDAATVDGDVDVTTRGAVEAATVSGDIRAVMGVRPSRDLDFRTVSGRIDVTLPADADAAVSLSSFTGDISADFPLERGRRTMGGGGRARGTIGRGGRTIYAQTLSGPIRVRTASR